MARIDQFARSRELFQGALELDPSERDRFLEEGCAGDVSLREEVLSLLRAHEDVSRDVDEIGPAAVLGEQQGDRVGRYKLLQKIGEGGFGTVWMAEQLEPVRRKVALKIIKLGMDTKQVVARFEAERQALAMMDHPHIAKVLDGGATDSGRPYFVMDLVRGDSITAFCDDAQMDAGQRLELFVQVCQAVQHAHQKGIIHRDIKPSNVLITLHDGVPVPKVIDFGIAKATSAELTQKTMFTEFRQMIGTPQYMAPEQAEMSGLDVDTRADIYSLGVLLYELLTGTQPFDLQRLLSRGYAEIVRVIKEEDPPRPSTRVTTLGESSNDIAKRRHTRPDQLSRSLRGDLDCIVMKALEKDRARRYDTASAFADDILRHLRDEPVTAGRPSGVSRLRKYVRRHRVGVLSGAGILGALVVGLGVALWGLSEARAHARRAEDGEQAARSQARRADTVLDLVDGMLSAADPHEVKGKDYTVRQLLDDFDRGLGARLGDEPEVEASIRRLLGRAYSALGLYEKAEPHLEAALSLRQRVHGEPHSDVALSLLDRALLLHHRGSYREALALLDAVHDTFAAEGDAAIENLACTLSWQSDLLQHIGEMAQAEALARQAVEMQRALAPLGRQGLEVSLGMLASALRRQGDHAGAEEALREALAVAREHHDGQHPNVAVTMNALALALADGGALAEAESEVREALRLSRERLGARHPLVATSLHNLAVVLSRQGRLGDAEEAARAALELRRELFGDSGPQLVATMTALGGILSKRGELDEAISILQRALEMQRQHDASSPQMFKILHDLGHALGLAGRYAEAEQHSRQAWLGRQRLFGDAADASLRSLEDLAFMLESLERWDEALPMRRELLESGRATWGEEHPRTLYAWHALGCTLGALGRHEEGDSFTREAWERARRAKGETDAGALASLENLARSAEIQAHWDEAVALREQLLRLHREAFGDDDPRTVHSLYRLGDALGELGRHGDAEPVTRDAWERSKHRFGGAHAVTLAAQINLARHLTALGREQEAGPMWREIVEAVRLATPRDRPRLASCLARAGSALLEAEQFVEAEPLLRECVALRGEAMPESWLYCNALSLLGGALAGQGRHEEADALLVEGFERMRPPPANADRRREALERLIHHCEDWGKTTRAEAYRARLAEGQSEKSGR